MKAYIQFWAISFRLEFKQMKKVISGILAVSVFLGCTSVETVGPKPKIECRLAQNHPGANLVKMQIEDTDRTIYVSDEVLLSNADIASVSLVRQESETPWVELVLTEPGKVKFSEATEANIGRPVAILVDGAIVSAPVVRARISGGLVSIRGLSKEKARNMVDSLNAGQ